LEKKEKKKKRSGIPPASMYIPYLLIKEKKEKREEGKNDGWLPFYQRLGQPKEYFKKKKKKKKKASHAIHFPYPTLQHNDAMK